MRLISEVGNHEKVQIHFESTQLKKGYAEIARLHKLDNGDIYYIVAEIEKLRSVRTENREVKRVYRRIHINKHMQRPVLSVLTKKVKAKKPDVKLNTAMAHAFQNAKVSK